jgi:hypothetical protein
MIPQPRIVSVFKDDVFTLYMINIYERFLKIRKIEKYLNMVFTI